MGNYSIKQLGNPLNVFMESLPANVFPCDKDFFLIEYGLSVFWKINIQ